MQRTHGVPLCLQSGERRRCRYGNQISRRGLMEGRTNSLLYIGKVVALLNDELDETIAWTDQFEP
jgi:hypothetical protein